MIIEKNGFRFTIIRENAVQNIVQVYCMGGTPQSDNLQFDGQIAYDSYNKSMYGNLQEYVDATY